MAIRLRREERILLLTLGGIVALGAVSILVAELFSRYRSYRSGISVSSIRESQKPPLSGGGRSISREPIGEGTKGRADENLPRDDESSWENEIFGENWRGDLADEMELSEEQREILEMIPLVDPEESSQGAETRERTLKEFFTQEQCERIEERLKRYSLEGYRQELRSKETGRHSPSP